MEQSQPFTDLEILAALLKTLPPKVQERIAYQVEGAVILQEATNNNTKAV